MPTIATEKQIKKFQLEDAISLDPWNIPEQLREQFRKLRSVLCSRRANTFCIGVCSHGPGEGVSWVASKLACAIAENGTGVILLDANLSQPSQRTLFGMDDTQRGSSTKMGSALPETHATQLQIATSIPSSFEDPSSSNAELASIISQLRHSSQNIVVDCEPLQNSAQVFQFSSLLDGVLLVVEAENQRREVIGRTLESLKRAQIPVMGTVLSKRKQYIPPMIYRML